MSKKPADALAQTHAIPTVQITMIEFLTLAALRKSHGKLSRDVTHTLNRVVGRPGEGVNLNSALSQLRDVRGYITSAPAAPGSRELAYAITPRGAAMLRFVTQAVIKLDAPDSTAIPDPEIVEETPAPGPAPVPPKRAHPAKSDTKAPEQLALPEAFDAEAQAAAVLDTLIKKFQEARSRLTTPPTA